MGETDVCSSLCLDRGKTFCARADFTAGICCSESDGCPEQHKMSNNAVVCSDTIDDPLLKHFPCPMVASCGPKIVKAFLDQTTEISVSPVNTAQLVGDKCSYLLSVDEYSDGDQIELTVTDAVKNRLTLFYGGYSLASASKRISLEDGQRYQLDGTQMLFLVTETIQSEDSMDFSKPHFNIQMKKMAGKVPNTESTSLNDADILSNPIIVEPLVVTVEGEKQVSVSSKGDPVEIYNQIVEKRKVQDEADASIDDALKVVIWGCFGLSLLVTLLTCAAIGLRHLHFTSGDKVFKVHAQKDGQETAHTSEMETDRRMQTPREIDDLAYLDSNSFLKVSAKPAFEFNSHHGNVTPLQSRNRTGGATLSSERTNFMTKMSTFNTSSIDQKQQKDLADDDEDDDLGLNAFNTDDALKQSDNPTHAVELQVFNKGSFSRLDKKTTNRGGGDLKISSLKHKIRATSESDGDDDDDDLERQSKENSGVYYNNVVASKNGDEGYGAHEGRNSDTDKRSNFTLMQSGPK